MDVAPSHVVVKAGLRNLLLRVYCHLMGRNIHTRIRMIVKSATDTQALKILTFPDLEDVFSRGDVSDVDPLTVDVGVVGVIATRTQPLWPDTVVKRDPGWIIHPINRSAFGHLSVWRAGVSAVVSRVTGSVLQTETGLVALGNLLLGVSVQQLVQAELVHAVEVAEK